MGQTQFEKIASELIGDGRRPNVYFVTDQGKVQTITLNKEVALDHWRALAARWPMVECALEDRQTGVLASIEPTTDDEGAPLAVFGVDD